MQPVPQKFQTLGVLNLVAGVCNVAFGWFVSSLFLSLTGGLCTSVVTCGFCPAGVFCGVASWLIIPVGMLEIVLGILMLVSPDAVKGFVSWIPLLQVPMLLLGDFVSPVMGIVGFVLARDPEVVGYIEGM